MRAAALRHTAMLSWSAPTSAHPGLGAAAVASSHRVPAPALPARSSALSALAARLATWHDAMVAHERRLRTGRTGDVCDDECPHVEARTLWAEALAAFGERAHELSFLRSRATNNAQPIANTVGPRSRESERANHERPSGGERTRAVRDSRGRPVTSPTLRPRRMMTEAEL